ncbi:MAG TPA: hypothetical protein VGH87_24000 [Polyangiaceae bacterium]
MKRPLTIALALTLASVPAHAFDDSTRKPFYLQSAVGSFSYWPVLFQNQSYWKPDLEFGVHFTGRADGLALGVRQSFDVGRDVYSMGETVLRGGWDFALPFRNGRFELVLAPFATFGVNYTFQNLHAGVRATAGFDAKLFFFQGLYLLVRPIELGFGEFVDLGPFQQNVYFTMNAGLGLGYAF